MSFKPCRQTNDGMSIQPLIWLSLLVRYSHARIVTAHEPAGRCPTADRDKG